jgi:leucyl aminopeptidase
MSTETLVRTDVSPTPSVSGSSSVRVQVDPSVPATAAALGMPVGVDDVDGEVPAELGVDRSRLVASGFDASVGAALVVPTKQDPTVVAVGVGDPAALDMAALRDAAAAFARAASSHAELAFSLAGLDAAAVSPELAAQAVVEGVLLARYGYDPLRSEPKGTPVTALTLVTGADQAADQTRAADAGARRGRLMASATRLARDLANTPHSHLTATRLAEIATTLAADRGLGVEVFDEDALVDMGCGGLLGVNAGSAEPPRMVKLTYDPASTGIGTGTTPTGRLALVGKGIMYDSGGLALKPGDEVHAQMKNDMSGAAAILAAMSALADLGCTTAVTGYLMCTDNMPSGTAMALGDVITMRGGTTVEVINTDAEGRLVMADALVLATEEPADAIVDIATLTGACMRALGTRVAGVMGNDQQLVEQVRIAAGTTDEPVWPLPLEPRYRKELDSTVADLKNLGGANAGAITAGLFLAEFVDDVPWAHVDIAGTAQSAADAGWQTAGCSGFGARLLAQLAMDFTPPSRA